MRRLERPRNDHRARSAMRYRRLAGAAQFIKPAPDIDRPPQFAGKKQVIVVNNSRQILDVAVFRRQELTKDLDERSYPWQTTASTRYARVSPIVRVAAYAPQNQVGLFYDPQDASQSNLFLFWTPIRPGVTPVTGCWLEMYSSPSVPLPQTVNSVSLARSVGKFVDNLLYKRPENLVIIDRADVGCCPGYERWAILEGTSGTQRSCLSSSATAPPPPVRRPPPPRPDKPAALALAPPPLLSDQMAPYSALPLPPPVPRNLGGRGYPPFRRHARADPHFGHRERFYPIFSHPFATYWPYSY
jgi:hypothetical protein